MAALRRFCAWIAVRMVSNPGAFSLAGLAAVVCLAFVYSGFQPSYRLADQVPDKEQAVAANNRLDAETTGSNPVYVLVNFPPGKSLYAPETLSTIAEVHKAVESQRDIGSLESLRQWLAQEMGTTDVGALRQYVDELPLFLVRRFVNKDENAVIVFSGGGTVYGARRRR